MQPTGTESALTPVRSALRFFAGDGQRDERAVRSRKDRKNSASRELVSERDKGCATDGDEVCAHVGAFNAVQVSRNEPTAHPDRGAAV